MYGAGSVGPALIVGAGPTGLTAALELSRMGIDVRIVDDERARATVPPAVVMGSQTVGLLRRRGYDQELLRGANQVAAGAIYEAAGLVGKVPLTSPQGRHDHSLLVPQAETEQVLRDQLAQQGVAVERATELIAFAGPALDSQQPPDEDVRCILRHHDGRLEEMTVPYLISADGTFGTVRQKLDPPGQVKHARRGYVVADLELDGDSRSTTSRSSWGAVASLRCSRCEATSSGASSQARSRLLEVMANSRWRSCSA